MNDTGSLVFSAFLGGLVGFLLVHAALEARWRLRCFFQNRRFQRIRQRQTQIFAHEFRKLFYDEKGLPARMDAPTKAKLRQLLAQYGPEGAVFIFPEFIERQKLGEQVDKKPQALADILTEKGEASPHA